MVVRGVPHRIAKDAWWLDDCDPPKGFRAGPLLIIALIGADLLVWDVRGGLGFAVWILLAAMAIYLTVWRELRLQDRGLPFAVLVLSALPLVEVVQFPTVMMALVGTVLFGILITGRSADCMAVARAMGRWPFVGVGQIFRDAFALRVSVPDTGRLRAIVLDWALPVCLGGVFLVLLVAANPLLDRWAMLALGIDAVWLPDVGRVVFWGLMACVIWPLIRLQAMRPALFISKAPVARPLRSGLLNLRSVRRALIIFNLIFAVQTVLDLGYLWGGFALPEGMTYANYAQRGAYPLLATALFAGLFAIIAQPFLGEGNGVRRLLYLWIAQTLLLVLSSILRLDLYVDAYGLTRLRFAAFVWMAVVAGGLGLIIMQMIGRHSIGWFIARASGVGFVAFYICCLVNIDGLVARNNLAHGFDDYYLCQLSAGAAPAMRAHELETGKELCGRHVYYLHQPADWREWGYRNVRLRHSLAALEDMQ